jgi:hypothetical protein
MTDLEKLKYIHATLQEQKKIYWRSKCVIKYEIEYVCMIDKSLEFVEKILNENLGQSNGKET